MTNKILLSTLTTLALLINGCGSGSESNNMGKKNPETLDNPVVVVPDPVEPEPVEPDPIEPEPISNPYKTAGWYGKTKVSIDINGKIYSHNTAGVFGQLVQSNEGKDLHDIAGYGDAFFQIVFPQTDWDDDNGDYFSNYQGYEEGSTDKKVWTFQLKAGGVSSFPIAIALEGVFDVRYKEENEKVTYKESIEVNQTIVDNLYLVDVDKAQVYTVEQLATANLDMNGSAIRTFRWVLGVVEEDDYAPLVELNAISMRMSTRTTDDFLMKTSGQKTSKNLRLPPQ